MKILNQKSMDEKLTQAASVVPEKMVSEIKSFILSTDDSPRMTPSSTISIRTDLRPIESWTGRARCGHSST